MTQERLLQIIVYTKSLKDAARRRIDKHKDHRDLQSEAIGSYTSLSHIVSILRREVKTHTNV